MNMKLCLIVALAFVAISAVVAKPSYNEMLEELRELVHEERGKKDGDKSGSEGQKAGSLEKSNSHEADDDEEKAFHHEQMEMFHVYQQSMASVRNDEGFRHFAKYCKDNIKVDVDTAMGADETYGPVPVTAEHFTGAISNLHETLKLASANVSSALADSEGLLKQISDPTTDWEQFGKDHEVLGDKIYTTLAKMEGSAVCGYSVLRPLLIRLAIFGTKSTERCNNLFVVLATHAYYNKMNLDQEACNISAVEGAIFEAFHADIQCVAKDVEETKAKLEQKTEGALGSAGLALQLMTTYDDMRLFKGALGVTHQLYTKKAELASQCGGGKRMLDATVMRKIKDLYNDLKNLQ